MKDEKGGRVEVAGGGLNAQWSEGVTKLIRPLSHIATAFGCMII